jgi:DNA-binding LacI/PurR family transcriptional regulator
MHAEERHQAILRRVREHGSMRVTDVAGDLGVSPVTIRKDVEVLAERGLLARVHGGAMLPETVAETAPDTAAPSPAPGQPLVLGMIVPSASYYYPDVIKGAREAASAQGARLVLRVSDYDPGEEHAQARQMIDGGIDGLLIAPSGEVGRPGAPHWHEELPVPTILLERRPDEDAPAVEHVVTDHVYGARLAVRHLVDIGRQRIALLMRGNTPTAPWIEEGYRAGLRAAGLAAPEGGGFIDLGGEGYEAVSYDQPMTTFLDAAAAGRIDAVIVHPENDALALLQRLRGRGLAVPRDIAVVSYDDEVAALADVPLTAVAPSKHEVGVTAVELLVLRVRSPHRPRRRMFILPELHVRESSSV